MIKITALTGTPTCEIVNGNTLNRVTYLNQQKISKENKDTLTSNELLIIDKVSFMSIKIHNLRTPKNVPNFITSDLLMEYNDRSSEYIMNYNGQYFEIC